MHASHKNRSSCRQNLVERLRRSWGSQHRSQRACKRRLLVELLAQRELLAGDFANANTAVSLPPSSPVNASVVSNSRTEIMASLAERTDVNQDEAWTSLDALNIVNAIALGWGVEQLPTGDLNDDSLLDAKDVSIALAYAEFWEASQADGIDRDRAEDESTPE